MKHKASNERVYLREWRLAKGLTQPDLARRVGTVKSEVSRLENGSRKMTLDWMSAFATAMGISVEDLMTIPPMGFGAVSPAPRAPAKKDEEHDFETVNIGDTAIGVDRETHAATTITGDDWSGTFGAGDVLIYDKNKRSTAAPGIMVFDVGGEVVVRRVTPSAEGSILTCANAAYPPIPLATNYKPMGRVVARIHRV